MYRTHLCGELRKEHEGKEVTLSGWVNTRRDHGGLLFIDLRDENGITQLRFDPKVNEEAWKAANTLRSEFVITVSGTVEKRPKDMINAKLPTGEIELAGSVLRVLNTSKTPPFEIDKDGNVNEELRLTYRYLDLRRPAIRKKLKLRADFVAYVRQFLIKRGFQEVETPILTKSTPEGARDYLVPSRLHPGKFYALPQSPQQYKQLLMVGGFDKYFQIAPCFRDEDARHDRAPDQFYQIDLEMAFCEQDEILVLLEELYTSFIESHTDKKILAKPWPRISYKEAFETYGSDKPDLRFEMKLVDITRLAQQSTFEVFKNAELIKAIRYPNAETSLSRKGIDELIDLAKKQGAKGLTITRVKGELLNTPLAKFMDGELQKKIIRRMEATDGDSILFVADEYLIVHEALGALRKKLGDQLQLADPNVLAFAYIIDFPLFEPRKEKGHFAPMHHMFTRPKEEDIPLLDTDPHAVRSWQHDMVLNGYEIAGGSLRIYTRQLQEKIFELIGFEMKKAHQDFSHMLEAFEFGAPPHGGIAPGIDRFLMTLLDEPNIREVTAFPKTGDNRDLMLNAPSDVEPQQLKDVHLKIV